MFFSYKVLLLGSSGVGKTSILKRISSQGYDDVHKTTIGCDFIKKIVHLKGQSNPVRLLIWDTAGTERYANVSSTFYRGADFVIFVFDITNKDSFDSIIYWESKFREIEDNENVPYIIVANKCDDENIQWAISKEEVQLLCKSMNIDYHKNFIEVSAKSNYNIEELVNKTAQILSTNIQKNTYNKETINLNNEESKKQNKCICSQ